MQLSIMLNPSVEEFEDELRQILNHDRLHKVLLIKIIDITSILHVHVHMHYVPGRPCLEIHEIHHFQCHQNYDNYLVK